jgi:hypothetical protein
MSMDPGWIFLSLIISGAGMGFFIYGKKQSRYPHLVAGLLLIGYTYFVESLVWMVVIAAAILAALWWAIRRGL